MTPEERELMDVQKQMEEEMVEEYKQVGAALGTAYMNAPCSACS